ncbi:hypothetical protein [Rhizobium phaseoli]|uniref:hypothetical protein n=1 Tax=Rhizobium phaseoli TaxID=396 RepID=UPI0011AE5F5F|nr:hypothetical protein [Rhizobium phaseoli]
MTGIVVVIAGAQLCQNSSVNIKAIAGIMFLSGLDNAEAQQEIMRRATDVVLSAKHPPSQFACDVILDSYGPNGKTAKNLLIPK